MPSFAYKYLDSLVSLVLMALPAIIEMVLSADNPILLYN